MFTAGYAVLVTVTLIFSVFYGRPADVRKDGAFCYTSRRSYAELNLNVPALQLHPVSDSVSNQDVISLIENAMISK